ncbi:MAG: heme ABC exporter ATP-binding protein CcmA [Alphaproteobacteria bacterium]
MVTTFPMYSVYPSTSICFDNVSAVRGTQSLFAGLSFMIKSGELMWIQGSNGIGKTTLLRLAAGLSRPAEGTVSWHEAGETCRSDQIISYQAHLNAQKRHLCAREDLQFWADIYDFDGDIAAPLASVGLKAKAHVKTGALSAGQSRRLALARMLISDKPIWLMDEPAAAMDAEGQTLIFDVIQQHLAQNGVVLLASHEPARALKTQTRKLTLKAAAT